MLILVGHATTPDKLKIITSAAGDIDVYCSYIDCSDASPPVPDAPNKQATNITTATTTDVLAGVANAAKRRNVKQVTIRNTHASVSNDVTVVVDAIDGSDYELHKATLDAGEMLEYHEGIGWFEVAPSVADLASGGATTAQIASHSADTYYLGFPVTSNGITRLRAGSWFRWAFGVTKGAAGTAAPTFNIRYGTAGTTADTSRALMTMSAQTAAADSGYIIISATFRTVGAAAVIVGRVALVHQLATTGLNSTTTGMQLVQTVGGSFDSSPVGSIIGLSVNPGTSGAWVVEAVDLDVVNLVF